MKCRAYKAGTIIRLILAEYKRQQEELAFRIYMTESIRLLTENTARFSGGSVIKERYYDIVNRKHEYEEEKSGDEIVRDIVTRAELELI